MRQVFDPGSDIWKPSLEYVYMKARRADFHLQSAEKQFRGWVDLKPYTMREQDNLERTKHAFIITPLAAPEEIALTVGDFVNCLRSALDQLAWNLVNLFPETIPTTEKLAVQVVFPICRSDDAYRQKKTLFHTSIHGVLDSLQPNDRAHAIHTEPLWQLDKLWNIDKHRTIPVNCGNWTVKFAGGETGWIVQRTSGFEHQLIAVVPCRSRFEYRPRYVKPQIIPDILFGEYMGTFAVSIGQLRDIYAFVTREVIPKFTGFFPSIPTP